VDGVAQAKGLELAMAMKTVKEAMENMEYVRRLLGQKQPGFAASLELAASQLERKLRESVSAPQNCRHVRSPAVAALVADLEPGQRDGAARPRPLAWESGAAIRPSAISNSRGGCSAFPRTRPARS
jgi:hypothetical protein